MSRAKIEKSPRIVIAGRPNAGKSTLFNRLLRRRKAIVDPTPGVTRDENRAEVVRDGQRFELVDTGGIEAGVVGEAIAARVHQRSEAVLRGADVVLYLLDGKAGLSPADSQVARRLRALGLPVVFAVNRSTARTSRPGCDTLELGEGDLPSPRRTGSASTSSGSGSGRSRGSLLCPPPARRERSRANGTSPIERLRKMRRRSGSRSGSGRRFASRSSAAPTSASRRC